MALVREWFQSPNGVQIAFEASAELKALTLRFQSPNGVQIAFVVYSYKYKAFIVVSITKRCTDCFICFLRFSAAFLVSITKRCTDCFDKLKRTLAKLLVSITKRCTDCFNSIIFTSQLASGFNHQTVYRLL